MKYIPHVVGALLGLMFIAFSIMFFVMVFTGNMKVPEGVVMTPEAVKFNESVGVTGYMYVVKICELLGGILVAIPRTRNFGLLFLGPVIVNIACYHVFLQKDAFQGATLVTLLIMGAMSLYLLWVGRANFAALKN